MPYNFKETEKEIGVFWNKIKLLEKLQKKNSKGKNYFLLDGPPYANFVPHVGHIRNTVYKDLNIRLAFARGYNVFFQPGFDTHGLPVENIVEKKLGLKSKKDIEKIGISKFTNECKKLAATNKDLWMEVYALLGSWYSHKEPYMTFDNSYLESAWWSFKEMWKKGLVYQGKKPVFWCPHCETALAGYEVTDSYTILSDPGIYVKFKIKGMDEYLLVFTTTPYTLVSNVVIAVHPDEDYVKVDTNYGTLVLAKERLDLLSDLEIGYTILEEFKGKKLEGLEYESILDVPQQKEVEQSKGAHKIYMSIPILKERIASKVAAKKNVGESRDIYEDFVDVKEGTGLVHVAGGHGKTDNELSQKYNLICVSPVDDVGKFTELAGKYAAVFVKSADEQIINDLRESKKLVYSTKIEHKYPICWRCKNPLIFRMSNQWFFRTDLVRDKMLNENKKVKWFPDYAGERFIEWVANAEDWNFSRQRYWGIPIPIWRCSSCNEEIAIAGFDELSKKASSKLHVNFDLHNVNDIKLKCKCGSLMERINDIFDVWYDSGVAPWASLGFPHKNKQLFEKNFPVSRINESQDQIRGWFYSLMYCGIGAFNKKAYDGVSMPGWVLDDKGNKMSKSLGNVVFAKDALTELGADALRFYYLWDIAPYETQKFNAPLLKKEVWRFFNALWNIHIYLLGMNNKYKKVVLKNQEDKWAISKLNSLIKNYSNGLDDFNYHESARNLEDFVINNLSREYIQIVRGRVDEKDPVVIYVLFESLLNILKLLAPVAPFISEKIYLNLKEKFKLKEESIHLASWPKYDNKRIDKKLEKQFEILNLIAQSASAEREKIGYGIRWPLSKVEIKIKDLSLLKNLSELIKTQLNVKEIKISKGEFEVKLDNKITKELEIEGYTREVMRRIQALRKKNGLKKEEKIKLIINSDYDISKFKKEIMDKVGAKVILFNSKILKIGSKENIKGEEFEISFQKV